MKINALLCRIVIVGWGAALIVSSGCAKSKFQDPSRISR